MNTDRRKTGGIEFVGKIIYFVLYFWEFMGNWLAWERCTKVGSSSVYVPFLSYSLHLNGVLQENLGFLAGVGLAPDGHSLILANADLQVLHMKPGDAPSIIW